VYAGCVQAWVVIYKHPILTGPLTSNCGPFFCLEVPALLIPPAFSDMSLFKQITQESRGTLALSLPLIAGHLSHMLMGLADTVMIGQLGAAPLAASALSNSLLHLPLVLIREMTARGASEIFVYMQDHDNIFSRIAKTLDLLNLNILDARIITSATNFTLDTFIVLETNGERISGRARKREIQALLRDHLLDFDKPIKAVSRIRSRRLKNFPVPTRISFSQDKKNNRTIMEVTATDRPGLLSAIGGALEGCNTRLQSAKIATYGERVEDIFFITDQNNRMIRSKKQFECLQNTITETLK